MTAIDFTNSLEAILTAMSPSEILQIPEVYNALANSLGDQALNYWRDTQLNQLQLQQ